MTNTTDTDTDVGRDRIGRFLRKWRKAAGHTQVTAAEAVKASQPAIAGAERDSRSLDLLRRLIDLYTPPPEEVADAMRIESPPDAAGAAS